MQDAGLRSDDEGVIHADDPDLRDLFEEEAGELLDAIELLLGRLQEPAAMAELRRHAHTVKGSSAIMGLAEVNAVAIALEQLFETLETRPTAAGPDIESTVRAAVADLRFLVSGLLGGLDVGNVAADAEQSLRAIETAIAGPRDSVVAPAGGTCASCARLEPLVEAMAAAHIETLRLVAASVGTAPGAIPELLALQRAVGAASAPTSDASSRDDDDAAMTFSGPSPARRGAVIVVDDSRTVRERHRFILTAAGYHVRTAAEGAEALRLLGQRPADAVITDLDMPGMDGLRLTEAIRARPELSCAAVVVVTSHDDAGTRDRSLAAGADAFLPKDRVDADKLVAQVARLLEDAP